MNDVAEKLKLAAGRFASWVGANKQANIIIVLVIALVIAVLAD